MYKEYLRSIRSNLLRAQTGFAHLALFQTRTTSQDARVENRWRAATQGPTDSPPLRHENNDRFPLDFLGNAKHRSHITTVWNQLFLVLTTKTSSVNHEISSFDPPRHGGPP